MKGGAWWRRISFRARMTSLVAVAVGVAVALASLAAYVAVSHQLYSQFDSSLESETAAAAQALGTREGSASFLDQHPDGVIQVVTFIGPGFAQTPLMGPALPVSAAQEDTALQAAGAYRIDSVTVDGVHYRVVTASLGLGEAVQVAQPLTDIIHSLSTLRLTLWLVSLAGIAVAVALGWFVGRATMRPVKRLTAAAEHVAATQDLSAIIEDEGEDELARLARSFNAMLSALSASRQQQAQLISDAGHELRTPLTSLRTNIEVLLRVRDLPTEDRANLLHDVNAQLEELTTLIGDVVDLARQDEQQAEPMEVRFDDIVTKALGRARRRAPSVRFECELDPGSVRAQPALLERAVLNVLDNAAKWSPPEGCVRVLLQRGDRWVLTIKDEGPGIPAADLPHVFDRFYRSASARSMPGSGLGLAIVQQVVTTHGGTVDISCPPDGGTVVRIELPVVAENEPEVVAEPADAPGWGSPAGRNGDGDGGEAADGAGAYARASRRQG